MKKCLRGVVSFILCCLLVWPQSMVYAATATLDANGVPTAFSQHEYIEIPMKQDGKVTSVFTQEMKSVDGSGTVYLGVRGFAYKTGSDVKIGVYFYYYGDDGVLHHEFIDQITMEKVVSEEHWKDAFKDYYIEKPSNVPFEFVCNTANHQQFQSDSRQMWLTFKTSTGTVYDHRTRHTDYSIAFNRPFEQMNDELKCTTLSAGTTIVDTYEAKFNELSPCLTTNVWSSPLLLEEDSTIQVDFKMEVSEKSKEPMYQFIQVEKVDNVPQLPITTEGWQELGDLSTTTYNQKNEYKDYEEEDGKISVQHYMFTGSYTNAPQQEGNAPYQYSRAEIFKYPIGDVIEQSTQLGDNTKYSTQEGEKAFFKTHFITNTTLEATFVPKTTGTYYFSVYSNDDAKGTLCINGKDEEFTTPDDASDTTKNNQDGKTEDPMYRTNNKGYALKAGRSYPICIETSYNDSQQLAPCFMYSVEEQNNWQMVTPDLLKNQNPSNGSARAAKLWGFIEPDVSGTFNFGLKANDGAYGYINVNGEDIVFADSFGTGGETDPSSIEKITLEKGKIYPIYMEWYKAGAGEETLAPCYKQADSDTWTDIPANWFHPSNSKTPAIATEAMYESAIISKGVPIPNDKINYMAFKFTDKNGVEHQTLYGPFQVGIGEEVVAEPPQKDDDGNYIVPTSISNFNATITYGVDAKDIKYVINLEDIVDTTITGGEACFKDEPLSDATVQVICRDVVAGDSSEMVKVGESDSNNIYKVDFKKNSDGSKDTSIIEIVANDPEMVVSKGSSHTINIYFELNFEDGIQYGSTGTESTIPGTYLELVKNIKHKQAKLTIYRQEKVREAVMLAVGLKPAEYQAKETTETVNMELREIPQIY